MQPNVVMFECVLMKWIKTSTFGLKNQEIMVTHIWNFKCAYLQENNSEPKKTIYQ